MWILLILLLIPIIWLIDKLFTLSHIAEFIESIFEKLSCLKDLWDLVSPILIWIKDFIVGFIRLFIK